MITHLWSSFNSFATWRAAATADPHDPPVDKTILSISIRIIQFDDYSNLIFQLIITI